MENGATKPSYGAWAGWNGARSAWFRDVGGLRALGAFHNLEFDWVALLKRAVAVAHDGGIVDKNVWAIIAPDEAIPLGVIEPLHLSEHFSLPPAESEILADTVQIAGSVPNPSGQSRGLTAYWKYGSRAGMRRGGCKTFVYTTKAAATRYCSSFFLEKSTGRRIWKRLLWSSVQRRRPGGTSMGSAFSEVSGLSRKD